MSSIYLLCPQVVPLLQVAECTVSSENFHGAITDHTPSASVSAPSNCFNSLKIYGRPCMQLCDILYQPKKMLDWVLTN